jgi:DNA mismatch repair protein MSH6
MIRSAASKPNGWTVKVTCIMLNNLFLSVAKVSKFDKVVKREICQITAKGTRVFSVIDGDASDAKNNYLLALTEKVS